MATDEQKGQSGPFKISFTVNEIITGLIFIATVIGLYFSLRGEISKIEDSNTIINKTIVDNKQEFKDKIKELDDHIKLRFDDLSKYLINKK